MRAIFTEVPAKIVLNMMEPNENIPRFNVRSRQNNKTEACFKVVKGQLILAKAAQR